MICAKERILNFIVKKGGRAKTMATYFISGCSGYWEFSMMVNELEKEGIIKRVENGEYLEVVK